MKIFNYHWKYMNLMNFNAFLMQHRMKTNRNAQFQTKFMKMGTQWILKILTLAAT